MIKKRREEINTITNTTPLWEQPKYRRLKYHLSRMVPIVRQPNEEELWQQQLYSQYSQSSDDSQHSQDVQSTEKKEDDHIVLSIDELCKTKRKPSYEIIPYSFSSSSHLSTTTKQNITAEHVLLDLSTLLTARPNEMMEMDGKVKKRKELRHILPKDDPFRDQRFYKKPEMSLIVYTSPHDVIQSTLFPQHSSDSDNNDYLMDCDDDYNNNNDIDCHNDNIDDNRNDNMMDCD